MRSVIPVLLALWVLAACASPPATVEPGPDLEPGMRVATFTYEGEERDYLLYLPEAYFESWQQPQPLVLFLHGSGEKGSNPRVLTSVPPFRPITLGEADYPFIIAAPHLTLAEDWVEAAPLARALLEHLQTRLSLDPERIAVTGFSLGGQGVWAFATAYPDLPAALAPVAGFWGEDGSTPPGLCQLAEVPTWVAHSEGDEAVPVEASRLMMDALEACGAEATYTEYEGLNHAQTAATFYGDAAFWAWLGDQLGE